MKFLINLCAHDGIKSMYTGVATMVNRYIDSICDILKEKNIDYELNLFTPEYKENSFGFSKKIFEKNMKVEKGKIIEVSNGSDGEINFGGVENWHTLSQNTANLINAIDFSKYDKVLTIFNDAPFMELMGLLEVSDKHYKVWIPHSTVKIHEVDSAISEVKDESYDFRLNLEEKLIAHINHNQREYVGFICEFMRNHLIKDYILNHKKAVLITNGELLDKQEKIEETPKNAELFKEIENQNCILFSFGRAEKYKNLEGTMLLGRQLGIKAVVIAQEYFKGQPITERYKKLAAETDTKLYINPPFSFAKYILTNFKNKIIFVYPSHKEPMGLIVNEIRKLNKGNILIVANNAYGLKEQIQNGKNGLILNIDEYEKNAKIIKKYLDERKMKKMCKNSLVLLKNKYDMKKNMVRFLSKTMEVKL